MKYDVIIVGAGPAGIFAALELAQKSQLKILIVEKGKAVCDRHSILSGWGGAGAFSDGKLTLSPDVGGFLEEYVSTEELVDLIHYVDKIFLKYGAPEKSYGDDADKIDKILNEAAKADLKLIPSKIRHLGTGRCGEIMSVMEEYLHDENVDIKMNTKVENVLMDDSRMTGVELADGTKIQAEFVVLATGRGGASWLREVTENLNLKTANNPVDVGVRVELPAVVMKEITDVIYESKLVYYSKVFDDKVRTFCMNPYGSVVKEEMEGLITVNGHSHADAKYRTQNTNFAILVSTTFTEPFKEPISYGRYLASLANLLGGGVLVQRLGDLQMGRRSTKERIQRSVVIPTLNDATPGDLSFVLPYRHLSNILEMLQALDKLSPGVNSNHTLLYGVEVKFYSMRLLVDKTLQTEIRNLYAVGDGAGITRGLVQAAASGVIAARGIMKRV
jgi:hypothetical protein